jgi:hypothetical protein
VGASNTDDGIHPGWISAFCDETEVERATLTLSLGDKSVEMIGIEPGTTVPKNSEQAGDEASTPLGQEFTALESLIAADGPLDCLAKTFG